ncbi:MAG: methionine--tRNA ligase [Candidatus Aenigmarchaeota archaeon]|nr:methionine--tRNA ligase [Candidatus Aenigmarchaeota archaeon]
MSVKKGFYITTTIPYANAPPHIGFALEIIQADVLARLEGLKGRDVFFLTGTDEHGTKNYQTAKKEGLTPQAFVDKNAAFFRELTKVMKISNSYFIRTTDRKVHWPGVLNIWKTLAGKGDIYKKKYEGFYCSGCERFITEKDLEDGKCPNHPNLEIQKIAEENYFFRLSKYSDRIRELVKSDELEITPEKWKNDFLGLIEEGLTDVSFSRDKEHLPWGIPVPGDENQVMYVWCDALTNYLTGVGFPEKKYTKFWPADIHAVGKDMLRFHAGIWPGMLLGAGIPLPKKIIVHGFLTVNGQKMSKSLGNVIDPIYLAKEYSSDSIRYFLIRNIPFGDDGDFSVDEMIERVNNELVSNIANFCYRTLSFVKKTGSGINSINPTKDKKTIDLVKEKVREAEESFEGLKLDKALRNILEIGDIGNGFFQESQPWVLAKNDKKRCDEVLALAANIVKDIIILLKPVTPDFCASIEKQLNLKDIGWKDLGKEIKDHKIGEPAIVLRNIEKKNADTVGEVKGIKFDVSPEVKGLGINFCAALLKDVNVRSKAGELERMKDGFAKEFANKDLSKDKIIKAYEELYAKVGVKAENPIRHLHQIVKNSGKFPTINAVVDAYNMIACKHSVASGAHDVSKIKGNVHLKIADGSENYVPLGTKEKEKINKGEYVVVDDQNVMCKLEVKQGDHTKIDKSSKNIFLYVQGNKETSDKYLEDSLRAMCELIKKICGGSYEILSEDTKLDPFSSLDLKVAKIISVEDHPNAEKLYKISIDLGSEKRQIIASIKPYYRKEELEEKNLVILSNLKPANLRGEESNGMLLAVEEGDKIGLLTSKAKPGTSVFAEGIEKKPSKVVEIKQFWNLKILAKKDGVFYNGKKLKTSEGDVTVDNGMEGKVC